MRIEVAPEEETHRRPRMEQVQAAIRATEQGVLWLSGSAGMDKPASEVGDQKGSHSPGLAAIPPKSSGPGDKRPKAGLATTVQSAL
jgi:hypothetical protein